VQAINAVMAGCKAKHLSVVIAACQAVLEDQFNLHGMGATTMGATPAIIVNGPARDAAGINSKHGALSSGHRAKYVWLARGFLRGPSR